MRIISYNSIKNLHLLISVFLICFSVSAQENDTLRNIRALYYAKADMVSALTFSTMNPSFIKTEKVIDRYTNITWQSQWAEFNYAYGHVLKSTINTDQDSIKISEFGVSAYIPLRSLIKGRRLYDISGVLLVPAISTGIVSRKAGSYSGYAIKFTPCISIQMPYFGIDFRLNSYYQKANNVFGIQRFSFTPEIGIKLDGLWNMLDVERTYIGYAKGSIATGTHTSGYTQNTTTLSGNPSTTADDVYITTATKNSSGGTGSVGYEFERYANTMAPIFALGLHYTYKNVPYAGLTRMIGLGYHVRSGPLATDLKAEIGQQGFASSALKAHTIQNPNPRKDNKVNKDDFSNPGYYNCERIYGRVGIDLWELWISAYGGDAAVHEYGEVKFTRVLGGIGYGYAFLSRPYYYYSNGLKAADAKFDANAELLSTSRNHARFASNSPFFTFYFSLEAGALCFTVERQRYTYAKLANVNTLSVSYLLPLGRIKSKRIAIKSYKEALNLK